MERLPRTLYAISRADLEDEWESEVLSLHRTFQTAMARAREIVPQLPWNEERFGAEDTAVFSTYEQLRVTPVPVHRTAFFPSFAPDAFAPAVRLFLLTRWKKRSSEPLGAFLTRPEAIQRAIAVGKEERLDVPDMNWTTEVSILFSRAQVLLGSG